MNKKDKARDYRLRRYYGISLEDYNDLRVSQGNKCFICHRPEGAFKTSLSVDHCHTTGKVRGLLCPWCNRGLRYFRDSPEALRRAAEHCERDNGFIVPKEFLKGQKKRRKKKKSGKNSPSNSRSTRTSRTRKRKG